MRSTFSTVAIAALLFAANVAIAAANSVDPASPPASPAPSPSPSATPRSHPQINWFNRWQEDWSPLADPSLRTDPFDSLKYIPIANDPQHYLSLGLTVRELPVAQSVQIGSLTSNDWLWSRLMIHADLHLGTELEVFTQLASYFAPWKNPVTPVDQDPLALYQGWVGLHFPSKDGNLDVRIGRQQIAFDLQRFVSDRDGPNVLQPFDAVWAGYQTGPWKFQLLYSQPVQTQTTRLFGDSSGPNNSFSGFHVERGSDAGKISAYVAQFYNVDSVYPFAQGIERRNVFDLRTAGARNGDDWDNEAMYQTGWVGTKVVRAWAVGNRYGYTWTTPHWSPRLGIQADAASGDLDPRSNVFQTFNPLFPNGYYVTLAGYPGYTNFWHVKPSLTLHPWRNAAMVLSVADIWRQSIADAVYTFPAIPVAGTPGRGISYTGTYQQLRIDWNVSPHVISAFEFEHFINAAWLAQVGAHNGNFAGLELEFGI